MMRPIESGSKQWHDRPPLRSDAARTQRQQLRDTISIALMRLNALAPISYMPTEILGTIFLIACDDHYSTSSRSTVIDISHVCRCWHIITIQNPRLWAIPPLKFGCDWMKTFLSRSGSTPLAIETGYSEISDRVLLPGMIKPLHEHFFRVWNLQIRMECFVLDQLLAELITPAPTLQSVEIEANSDMTHRTILSMLPQNIFAGDAPELKHVTLNSCIIPWDSTVFRNLASLDITLPTTQTRLFKYTEDGSLVREPVSHMLPTTSQLLGILMACPLLRSLALREALPQASHASSAHVGETPDNIRLSELAHVELLGIPHECEHFLSHLVLPSSGDLMLDSWTGPDTDFVESELTALLNLLKNRASSSTGDFRSASLWFCLGEGEIEIIIGNFNTRILVPDPLDHGILTNFARQFFAIIPLVDSVSLGVRFDDSPPLTREELMDIFAHDHLRCVDWVNWCGDAVGIVAFCAALWAYRETPSTNPALTSEFSMFPYLKTIGFKDVDFSDFTIREILRAHLVALQEQRIVRGSPIQKIKFTRCLGLDEEWMDGIRVFDETEIKCGP